VDHQIISRKDFLLFRVGSKMQLGGGAITCPRQFILQEPILQELV